MYEWARSGSSSRRPTGRRTPPSCAGRRRAGARAFSSLGTLRSALAFVSTSSPSPAGRGLGAAPRCGRGRRRKVARSSTRWPITSRTCQCRTRSAPATARGRRRGRTCRPSPSQDPEQPVLGLRARSSTTVGRRHRSPPRRAVVCGLGRPTRRSRAVVHAGRLGTGGRRRRLSAAGPCRARHAGGVGRGSLGAATSAIR
jgi:hypothetical protein